MTEITQADRDAAEAYREKVLSAIWEGKPEEPVLLEAFARRRMEERAAIVAWMMREEEGYPATEYSGFVAMIREEIEAGEHSK